MDDIKMIEAVERYIRGEMKPDERVHFEQLRKTNADIDQLVVEHTLFLHQVNEIAGVKSFKSTLNDIHIDLAERGMINSSRLQGKAKVVYLWNRYKRVAAIAASIAGITALVISALVTTLTPKQDNQKLVELSRVINNTKKELNKQKVEIDNLKQDIKTQVPPAVVYKSGGSGFLIDGKGYIITNQHIIRNARNIAVQNKKGESFNAKVIFTDIQKDLAILKIEDDKYKVQGNVPYSFSKSTTELAEPIFTLGYPRDEIVYGQGYLSAKTGYNGDTLRCQIAIAANPGNSGGPVLNHNGEVIGILSNRQTSAEGVVFAIQGKYINTAITELRKKDTAFEKVKIPTSSSLKGIDRVQQVKKMEDYVYMVKVN